MANNGPGFMAPSGEDANPMNRRLPAEVITRRRREPKKVEEKPLDEVQVDVKVALALKPEKRLVWLGKAFKMAEEGRASKTDLYDIVSNRKFAAGLHSKLARKARVVVHDSLELFSDKQQRYLNSDDWALNAFKEEEEADEDAEDDQPIRPPAPAVSSATTASTTTMRVSSSLSSAKERESKDKEPKEPEGGVWTVAEDTSARHRSQALDKARREATESKRQAEQEAKRRDEQERTTKAEADEAKRRALENEVDSSLMLLERLGGGGGSGRAPSPPRRERDRRERERDRDRVDKRGTLAVFGGKKHGLSRSRSISAKGSSSSRGRKRNKGKRSRSRERKKEGSSKKSKSSESFEDALKRRMAERAGEIDSARIPVVDPNHAKRWERGS